jgi:hypothetical protein
MGTSNFYLTQATRLFVVEGSDEEEYMASDFSFDDDVILYRDELLSMHEEHRKADRNQHGSNGVALISVHGSHGEFFVILRGGYYAGYQFDIIKKDWYYSEDELEDDSDTIIEVLENCISKLPGVIELGVGGTFSNGETIYYEK